ncbi:rhomboid family intramembrane serine protease [Kitasatospora sp. NPDC051170]|uniref:rhomboid family intramembrane serine protease n=1 Tax=Kitasatospora sp. NPDC051170 TaxID=3364056 RepID=UPI0037BAA3F3
MSPEDRPAGSGPQAALPGCYRHPGTETGVSCTRCERPICPQCMVTASVGFQCPECVGRGHTGARRATTRFGGVPVADGALVTRLLILANLLVWVLAAYVFTPQLDRVWSLYSVGLHRNGPEGVAEGPDQWYRLLTATFLHVEWWHIGTNMLALLVLGPALEEALGRLRFLGLYLLAGLGGSTLGFLIDGDWLNSRGASGAIFGLIGATVVLQLRTKGPLGPVLALLVFNAIVTYSRRDAIDWRAHLGGLLLGALVAVGLMYAPRERRGLVQGLTVVAALAVEAGMLAIGMGLYGG